jgi:hypothetical protein
MLTLRFEGRTREALDRIMYAFKEKLNDYPEVGQTWENIELRPLLGNGY